MKNKAPKRYFDSKDPLVSAALNIKVRGLYGVRTLPPPPYMGVPVLIPRTLRRGNL